MSRKMSIDQTLLSMERAALDRWGRGDPSGFLEISAPDVVYFDPFTERRVDGWEALSRLYEGMRGKIHIDRYELINPCIQSIAGMAVLTFNFQSWTGEETHRWNCTEVYRLDGIGWRIIQTHWSLVRPLGK